MEYLLKLHTFYERSFAIIKTFATFIVIWIKTGRLDVMWSSFVPDSILFIFIIQIIYRVRECCARHRVSVCACVCVKICSHSFFLCNYNVFNFFFVLYLKY